VSELAKKKASVNAPRLILINNSIRVDYAERDPNNGYLTLSIKWVCSDALISNQASELGLVKSK